MTARIKTAGSEVIHKWDHGSCTWLPENNGEPKNPEIAPQKKALPVLIERFQSY